MLNFCTESGKLHKNSITANIISAQRRQNPRFFIVVNITTPHNALFAFLWNNTPFPIKNTCKRLFAYTPLSVFRCPVSVCFVHDVGLRIHTGKLFSVSLLDERSSLKARDHLIYRLAQKCGTLFCTPYNFIKYWPVFKLFFTVRIMRKLVIIVSLEVPTRLKCIATLPCKMSVSWSNNWKLRRSRTIVNSPTAFFNRGKTTLYLYIEPKRYPNTNPVDYLKCSVV